MGDPTSAAASPEVGSVEPAQLTISYLTHKPTTSERVAFTVLARIIEPLAELLQRFTRGTARAICRHLNVPEPH